LRLLVFARRNGFPSSNNQSLSTRMADETGVVRLPRAPHGPRDVLFAAHNRLCHKIHGDIKPEDRESAAHEFLHSFLSRQQIEIGEEIGGHGDEHGGTHTHGEHKEKKNPRSTSMFLSLLLAAEKEDEERGSGEKEPAISELTEGGCCGGDGEEATHIDALDVLAFALATGAPIPPKFDGEEHEESLRAVRERVSRLVADRPIVVIDERTPEEQEISMMPVGHAERLFSRDIKPKAGSKTLKPLAGKFVIAHCAIGARSALLTQSLRKAGVDAWNLHGSMHAWAQAGGRFVTPDGKETKQYHTFEAHFDR
jgi:rhodanese-related sulfurtransferase